jgi:hypothetical protein
MWETRIEYLAGGRILRLSFEKNETPLSYSAVLRLWQDEADFRTLFLATLASSPFSAFRWETPPLTQATTDRPFEFVLLDSPGLTDESDAEPFARQFASAQPSESALAFANLGNDAVLVVPTPIAAASAYSHLAAFVRNAPEDQQHALWQLVGKTVSERLCGQPIWLSTAGAGVAWLHVRLDSRPKYYGHAPYRNS